MAAAQSTLGGGSQTPGVDAVYPPSANPYPGGRAGPAFAKISDTSFFLFGGTGLIAGVAGCLADTWMFDVSGIFVVTFVGGAKTLQNNGTYAAAYALGTTNAPGCRTYASAWTVNGLVYLFGGEYAAGNYRNDLWRFKSAGFNGVAGNLWQLVSPTSGASNLNNVGNATAAVDTASLTAIPRARSNFGAVLKSGSTSKFYLFGGAGTPNNFADLWSFCSDDTAGAPACAQRT
jgi:hypothetical protein